MIVPVLNEERNLPDCLASVRWADEVFVVDSLSRDGTCAIASSAGAHVVQYHYQPGGPRKKNWSLDNLPIRNDWVLLLDADERVTGALAEELAHLFAEGPRHAGYYLNRQQFFLGRWLKHGGNYPSWNLRLLRRDAGRYERLGTESLGSVGDVEVHEHILLHPGPAGYLHAPLLHQDYKDLQQFIDRHNRYSTWDAHMREILGGGGAVDSITPRLFGSPVERKRFLKRLWLKLPFKPMLRFVYMYILRVGFLDGRAGLIYAGLKAVQEFHIGCKIYEERQKQGLGRRE